VAAKYNGVEVNMPAFDYEKDSQADWFKAKNPSGKVPLLDTDNGTVFESNAIARYCTSSTRTPASPYNSSCCCCAAWRVPPEDRAVLSRYRSHWTDPWCSLFSSSSRPRPRRH
jgi:elongation factor 1-gamma